MTFNKLRTEHLVDINSTGYIYEHKKTGAQVMYLANDDQNRSFTISFNTPPYNDNGVAHILEHSVLNGSKKFPTKEPFVDLMKGSMNTFLNAMTYSDKTVYPVASANEKDFFNQMEVYLDAVFQPLFQENELILKQEGWHHHLEDPADDLTYRGVVYSEMKGSLASPDRQAYSTLQQNMYADSHLSYESGGIPSSIVTLDQEEFIEFYEKNYQPSNSLTILYGDLNIDQALELLDEYFSHYDKSEMVDISVSQPSFAEAKKIEDTYSIASSEQVDNKTYLAFGWDVVSNLETQEAYGLDVLSSILFSSSQSPLRKALLDSGLASEVSGGVMDTGFRKMFGIFVKGANPGDQEKAQEIIFDTLKDLVSNGIDPKLVEATVNRSIFDLKELTISENEPRGVHYSLTALSNWIYGADPFDHFKLSEYLEGLEDKASEGYFEELIQKYLLDNSTRIDLILKPEPGKNQAQEEQLAKELAEYKDNLSEDEINQLVEETHELLKRQMTADSAEDLAKIPHIEKEDITPMEVSFDMDISSLASGFKEESFYSYDEFTAGITYLDFYFEVDDLTVEEMQYLNIYSNFLQQLSTKTYPIDKLQTEIKINTGSIGSRVLFLNTKDNEVKKYFHVRASALESKTEKLLELVKELILNTRLDEEDLIVSTLKRLKAAFEDEIINSGNQYAVSRALSSMSELSYYQEAINGFTGFEFIISTLEQALAGNVNKISESISKIRGKIFSKKRLIVLYTGASAKSEEIKNQVAKEFSDLAEGLIGEVQTVTLTGPRREAFVISQDVNYVGIGMNAKDYIPYEGRVAVANNLINYEFLWNEIRVIAGAYGCSMNYRRSGELFFTSYRDPHIFETVETFTKTPEFLSELELDDEDLLRTVIGVMSGIERPKSPRQKSGQALSMHLTGYSEEEINQFKDEVLNVSLAEISDLAPAYQKALENYSVAVVGNQTAIEAVSDQFDEIYYID